MSLPGKEDVCGESESLDPCLLSDALPPSWSSAQSSLPPLNNEGDGQSRRSILKARPWLRPLQPLSIAQRRFGVCPEVGWEGIRGWPTPITPGGKDLNKRADSLKLDLSSIQRSPKKSIHLLKREKLGLFDKECSKVAEDIYLGSDMVAKDRDILKQNGITHILNCVGFVCLEYFKADFIYRTLWLRDSPSEDITSILYDVFDYFEDVRGQGGRIFVHCCQGVSRSTSLVIAYLMWREGQSYDDAFQSVKAARGIADPNFGFICQLLLCQKRMHGFPLSPTSLLRIYRMAPHSPYDPLHLVPKRLLDPSPSLLDSRGTFIIHIPSAIYVWIGKKCDSTMERDARGAVCQIIRYEKVQGAVAVIKEGEEPPYFWDAFSNFLPSVNKSDYGANRVESPFKFSTGDRKVDAYDVDYEIFQKAIKGGFVPPFSLAESELEINLPARENSWSVLRHNFASGNMKDFVTTTKSPVRLFPNSMSEVAVGNFTRQSQSSTNLLPSTSLSFESSSISSTSSPPYLSPDSISSYSSVNLEYLSNSPAASTLAAPDFYPQPSAPPISSNLTPFPSSQFITKTSEFIDVNFTKGFCSQSAMAPPKKSCLSLAERRGSLSKCLTLPMRIEEPRGSVVPSSSFLSQSGQGSRNMDTLVSRRENVLEPNAERDLFQECELHKSSSQSDGVGPCCGEAPTVEMSNESCKSYGSMKKTSCFTGLLASVSEICNTKRPLIYSWPSFEKVLAFEDDELDCEVFIFVTPSSDVGNTKDIIVYIWVGKSFKCSKRIASLGRYGDVDDLENVNWNQVSSDVLARIGLPGDTIIKIVKEDEEPPDLLALLSPCKVELPTDKKFCNCLTHLKNLTEETEVMNQLSHHGEIRSDASNL